MANRETSGPSRYSSTTTAPPARVRHSAAWSRAAWRSSVTTTPFPPASPSSFTTCGAPNWSSAWATSSMVVHTWAIAVGTPASAMTRLAKAFDPSSCAAAPDGPNVAKPASRSASATPATSGASGPITTRSTASSRARRTTSAGSVAATTWLVPTSAVPAFPGAMCRAITAGSAARARARACSRPPEPITRMSTPRRLPGGGRGLGLVGQLVEAPARGEHERAGRGREPSGGPVVARPDPRGHRPNVARSPSTTARSSTSSRPAASSAAMSASIRAAFEVAVDARTPARGPHARRPR